jgi:hypothetical protein
MKKVVCWINTDQSRHGFAMQGTTVRRALLARHKWGRMIKVVLAGRNQTFHQTGDKIHHHRNTRWHKPKSRNICTITGLIPIRERISLTLTGKMNLYPANLHPSSQAGNLLFGM